MMGITQVILKLRLRYAGRFNLNPMQINDGSCSDFAEDLEDMKLGVAVWGDEDWLNWSDDIESYPDWFSHFAGGHCFIWFEHKYYDSECPEGCNYVDELPFYQRQKEFIENNRWAKAYEFSI